MFFKWTKRKRVIFAIGFGLGIPVVTFIVFQEKPSGTMYLYSAVYSLYRQNDGMESIILTVWDGSHSKKFSCCKTDLNNSNGVFLAEAIIKNDFGPAMFRARQYTCSFSDLNDDVSKVGIVERSQMCSYATSAIPVFNPIRQKGKLAICAKIMYGSLSEDRLIEWLEYQRLMAVDKVLVMLQDINVEAYEVVKYYHQLGFLDVEKFPVLLPGSTSGNKLRGFEENRRSFPQFSHDEQVAVYNCQEKLQGYDFVGVIDFDEYIVHERLMNYKDMFKLQLMAKYPDAAGFTFNVSFFILDWKSEANEKLSLNKYVARTEPRYECVKNFYIPSRTDSVTTHSFLPKRKYRRYYLTNDNVVIHHYRRCPSVSHWKNCMSVHRLIDLKMLQIREEMTQRVTQVKKTLGSKF